MTFNEDGSVSAKLTAVDGAKAYVIHYGDANFTDPKSSTFMGYTESTDWTLSAGDVPAHKLGDTLSFYVQAFDKVGTGSNDIEKAQYLNTKASGTAWSEVATVEAKPTTANTIADITAYLDAKKIDHAGVTAKADLLALVK